MPPLCGVVRVGGDDVDLSASVLKAGVVVAASSTSVGQLKVKAAGMKISTDHLPFSDSSLTL